MLLLLLLLPLLLEVPLVLLFRFLFAFFQSRPVRREVIREVALLLLLLLLLSLQVVLVPLSSLVVSFKVIRRIRRVMMVQTKLAGFLSHRGKGWDVPDALPRFRFTTLLYLYVIIVVSVRRPHLGQRGDVPEPPGVFLPRRTVQSENVLVVTVRTTRPIERQRISMPNLGLVRHKYFQFGHNGRRNVGGVVKRRGDVLNPIVQSVIVDVQWAASLVVSYGK
mmetsp:Transcript_18070/g.38951  ORF Transcript_18070/g.38951 Transcript_18070/m.38951 type:complete len:221 (-) Transcript_18070:49-711(-)